MKRQSVLYDSVLFRTALDLYHTHQPADSGYCNTCGRFQGPARVHAVEVIAAAGVGPSGFWFVRRALAGGSNKLSNYPNNSERSCLMFSPARRLSVLGGDTLLARAPTPQEAYRHHIGSDEPVLEVRRESGGVEGSSSRGDTGTVPHVAH